MTTRLGLQVAILVAAIAWPAYADTPSRFVVFGDSLSDTGNVATATGGLIPAPPYYEGRFSSGPVWHEWASALLGIPGSQAFLQGGSNYAIGGAETDFAPGWGISSQILAYVPFNTPSPDELFVVWGGGNDYFTGQQDASVPVSNLALNILALSADGATQFLVPNLPPLGQTPRFLGASDEARLDTLIDTHNQLLKQTLQSIEQQVAGVQIHRLDIAGLFDLLTASPEAFGFTNITDPALDTATQTVVPNADEYVYWDDIHPTGRTHAWIGLATAIGLANAFEVAFNPQVVNDWVGFVGLSSSASVSTSVPEPSLLLIGGIAVLWTGRRRPVVRGRGLEIYHAPPRR